MRKRRRKFASLRKIQREQCNLTPNGSVSTSNGQYFTLQEKDNGSVGTRKTAVAVGNEERNRRKGLKEKRKSDKGESMKEGVGKTSNTTRGITHDTMHEDLHFSYFGALCLEYCGGGRHLRNCERLQNKYIFWIRIAELFSASVAHLNPRIRDVMYIATHVQ